MTTGDAEDSPERGGHFPQPRREVTVGLRLAAPIPCSVSSGGWECHPKKAQSRDAVLGSMGMFEGLHEANEIVYKIVCGSHVSQEQGLLPSSA